MVQKTCPKVVLIEDDVTLASLVAKKLEKNGYQVEIAYDGEAGLALINSTEPDIVLLDMMLPKKNGFEVLEELHETKKIPGLPLMIISNSGQPVEIDRALKLGAKSYLIKVNFSPDELLVKVQSLCPPGDIKDTAHGKDPQEKNTARTDAAGVKTTDTPEKSRTVLLVEDDMLLSDLLGKKLEDTFAVYKAGDVREAYRQLEKNEISVICLDIVLPGMSGFIFLEEIKKNEKYKDIPVLIISNLGQQEEVAKGLSLGAVGYIVKANSTPQEIADRVKEII